MMEVLPENLMHEVLEDWRGINMAIWQDTILKVASRGHESSLPFIPFLKSDEIICTVEIQLHENSCMSELFKSSRDERKGITKLDCGEYRNSWMRNLEREIRETGKQVSLHLRITPLCQDSTRWFLIKHSHPKMMPVVEFSRTSRWMSSWCNLHMRSWMGPTQFFRLRLRGFPVTV